MQIRQHVDSPRQKKWVSVLQTRTKLHVAVSMWVMLRFCSVYHLRCKTTDCRLNRLNLCTVLDSSLLLSQLVIFEHGHEPYVFIQSHSYLHKWRILTVSLLSTPKSYLCSIFASNVVRFWSQPSHQQKFRREMSSTLSVSELCTLLFCSISGIEPVCMYELPKMSNVFWHVYVKTYAYGLPNRALLPLCIYGRACSCRKENAQVFTNEDASQTRVYFVHFKYISLANSQSRLKAGISTGPLFVCGRGSLDVYWLLFL